MAWRAPRPRAGRHLAGAGRPEFMVGPARAGVGAGAGVGGAAALSASDRLGDRRFLGAGDRGCAGCDRPSAAAVRGGDPDGLGGLGATVAAGHALGGWAGGDPVHPGPGGPLAQQRQVAGDWAGGAGRAQPHRPWRRRPDRRAGRGGPGGDVPAGRLPLVRPQRDLPDHLPAGQQRPFGCQRPTRDGDPAGPRRAARPPRRGGQAVRAGRLGRLHPAAHHRQGRPAHLPVRQALRPEPSPRRPLVQAGPRAALRPPGGREAVQHRPPAGPAGGLRPVADGPGRAPQPDPATASSSSPPNGSTCWSPSSSTAPPSSARPRSTPR